MSMHSQPIPEIPPETVRVVRAAFPKGNLYLWLRDHLGTVYQDELFADLFPERGQPAYAPWRLALVTIFQFLENLTDRQAADAVRSRLDWKYCLSLELTDSGFDHTVLSEFRTRVVAQTAEERFLEAVLTLCKDHGWLKVRGRQRTDSTHILAKIRALNRAECVVETLRHALNILAVVARDWLQSQVQSDWLERYGHRASEYRLPTGAEKRQLFLQQVGQDGWALLTAMQDDPTSQWMLSIPAIDTLQRVWKQDYLPPEQGGTWRAEEERLPAAKLFYSPYDLDAAAGTKRSTHWIGYKVHVTETCDEDLPRLLTQVTTTIAPIPDRHALPETHARLAQRNVLPAQHLVDAGYVDAEALVTSQRTYQVELVGPTAKDYRWQARAHNGYALADFAIDWERKLARCPQGQISSSWTPTWTRNQEIIKIKFGFAICGACPVRTRCTKAKRRSLSVRRQVAHFALDAARQREQTEAFQQDYARRAGVEGVHAQGVRRMGLRRSRYIGEPRTHLQHIVTATAMNVCRLYDWSAGISPHPTSLSHFARFMKQVA
jgi:transposase